MSKAEPLRRTVGETVAERVKKIRKSLAPRPGVKSRSGYADMDYFAELVGAPDRQRVIAWEKGGEPQAPYRLRLAELSEGVYSPEDFRIHFSQAELVRRLEDVERRLAEIEDDPPAASTQPRPAQAPGRP